MGWIQSNRKTAKFLGLTAQPFNQGAVPTLGSLIARQVAQQERATNRALKRNRRKGSSNPCDLHGQAVEGGA